nr:uridine diphosphate-glycosyltransferases 340F1 [Glyphodes pyloalis]
MRSVLCFGLFFFLLTCEVKAARILGVFPIPSRSHQVVFQSYCKELAKNGHELVVITPNPTQNAEASNITEIDVSFSYNDLLKLLKSTASTLKRGVMMNVDVIVELDVYTQMLDVVVQQLKSEQVRKLLEDKTQKFDLLVVEGFFEYQLIVSEIFKAPVILFPSFMGFPEHYEMMGAIGRHPILFPNFHRMNYANLSFWGTLKELYYEYKLYDMFRNVALTQDRLLKENFGSQAPTTEELKRNVDMLFLNSLASFANNRPVPPNVVYLGSTHLQPVKEIPQELKAYLDGSSRGVIYVSFGSNIRPSMMEKSLLDSLLEAFESLPFDILWRFDGESLENVPKNVKWQQWFPQRDLLFHPNIKAFVTQCGLQSTEEAIDAEVPLVGVPMMAEQWYNAQKYVDLGIGVKLESLTLTANDLVQGVKTVVGSKSYKENIKRLKSVSNDQPQTSLERAVWWTEYVIRHRGAKHLRSPTADISWSEYYMLNIAVPVLGAAILFLVIILLVLRSMCNAISKMFCSQNKVKRN